MNKLALTAVTLALLINNPTTARTNIDRGEPTPYGAAAAGVATTMNAGSPYSGGGSGAEGAENAGLFKDFVSRYLFGGHNDRGDWYCGTCSVNPLDPGAVPDWAAFITSTVNATLWPNGATPDGKYIGQWKPSDYVSICNGKICITLTYSPYNGSLSWVPDPDPSRKVPWIKPDFHKYKNKSDYDERTSGRAFPGPGGGPVRWNYGSAPSNGYWMDFGSGGGRSPVVIVGPLEPAYGGGGGGGGGGWSAPYNVEER